MFEGFRRLSFNKLDRLLEIHMKDDRLHDAIINAEHLVSSLIFEPEEINAYDDYVELKYHQVGHHMLFLNVYKTKVLVVSRTDKERVHDVPIRSYELIKVINDDIRHHIMMTIDKNAKEISHMNKATLDEITRDRKRLDFYRTDISDEQLYAAYDLLAKLEMEPVINLTNTDSKKMVSFKDGYFASDYIYDTISFYWTLSDAFTQRIFEVNIRQIVLYNEISQREEKRINISIASNDILHQWLDADEIEDYLYNGDMDMIEKNAKYINCILRRSGRIK